MSSSASVVELNIGGKVFAVSSELFKQAPQSLLAQAVAPNSKINSLRDSKGRIFLDRNPRLFELVLDFYRNGCSFVRPGAAFDDWERLQAEAEYFRLPALAEQLRLEQRDQPGLQVQLQLLLEALQNLRRPEPTSSFVEVGETVQAVFVEGRDPQRQLLVQGECRVLRRLLKSFASPQRRLAERVDELGERRGQRLVEEDVVTLVLPDAFLRDAGLGGVDEFRHLLMREIGCSAAGTASPTQVQLPNGEARLLFRVQLDAF